MGAWVSYLMSGGHDMEEGSGISVQNITFAL
jgi:hypothetical protein